VSDHWPAKRRVTVVGAVWNLVLSIGKVLAGIVGQSQALVVDGVHSLSDLVGDAVVLAAARWGSLEADHNHQYGHARIETMASALIGFLLLAVAAGFLIDSVGRLFDPDRLQAPGWLALSAAFASVLVKEVLFHYTRRVARRTDSKLIEANAWHHRSDALSSVVVIVGVAGVMVGVAWLDSVAAMIVAIMVGWVGWQFVASAVVELVDTAVPERERRELEHIIMAVDGVRDFRNLRTRRMGGGVVMDVTILLDPRLSLFEADVIAAQVRRDLLDQSTAVTDVVVGIAAQAAPEPDS
jgi:cation diffusion facilitator family transporter